MEKQRTTKKEKIIENKHQNDRCKPSRINNYIKCEWANHFNQKAEILRLDKKSLTFLHAIYKDTFYIQRHKQTEMIEKNVYPTNCLHNLTEMAI